MTERGPWCIPEQTVGENDVVVKKGFVSRGDAFCPRCGRRSLVYRDEKKYDDIEMDVDDGIIVKMCVECVNDDCDWTGCVTMTARWTSILVEGDDMADCAVISRHDVRFDKWSAEGSL